MSRSFNELRRVIHAAERRSGLVRSALNVYRAVRWHLARPEVARVGYAIHNIELTNRCPMKCVMCPRTDRMTRPEGLMDFELFRSLIDQIARDCGKRLSRESPVWLHGFGESLVHPEFHKFMLYGKSKGVPLALSVNPLLVSEEFARRLIDADLAILFFSLDGHDNESFEKIRGIPNAWEKSKKNLLRYLEMKSQSSCKTKIIFSMINFSLNQESIARAGEFWRSVDGIDEFRSKLFVTWDGSVDAINDLGAGLARAERKGKVMCDIPWKTMTVTWDGKVVPCCYDYDNKHVVGDLTTHTLGEIWNGPGMQALRREFNSNNVTNALCRNCPSLYGEAVDEETISP